MSPVEAIEGGREEARLSFLSQISGNPGMSEIKRVNKESCQPSADSEGAGSPPEVVEALIFMSLIGHKRGLYLVVGENFQEQLGPHPVEMHVVAPPELLSALLIENFYAR